MVLVLQDGLAGEFGDGESLEFVDHAQAAFYVGHFEEVHDRPPERVTAFSIFTSRNVSANF